MDHVHARVGHELPPGVVVARERREDAGRGAGLGEQLGDQQRAGQRGLGRRLEHDRVAERERRGHHAEAEHDREVPGRDRGDDADRDALDQAQLAGLWEGSTSAVAREASAAAS